MAQQPPSSPKHVLSTISVPGLLCTCLWTKVSFALFSVLNKDYLTPLQKALTSRQGRLSTSQNMSGVHHETTIAPPTSCWQCSETSPYTYTGCQHWMEHSACSDLGSCCPKTDPIEQAPHHGHSVRPCHPPAPLQPFSELESWANLQPLHLRRQSAGRTARQLPGIFQCWRLQQPPVSLCLITEQPAPRVSLQ